MMRHGFRAKSQGRYGKRHRPGEMNKTEQAYADELELRKRAGEIADWWFERFTFKLADDCRYSPDFAILNNDGTMTMVDTKGSAFAVDAKSVVKLRLAAEQFYPFKFQMLTRRTKKAGGGWDVKEF